MSATPSLLPSFPAEKASSSCFESTRSRPQRYGIVIALWIITAVIGVVAMYSQGNPWTTISDHIEAFSISSSLALLLSIIYVARSTARSKTDTMVASMPTPAAIVTVPKDSLVIPFTSAVREWAPLLSQVKKSQFYCGTYALVINGGYGCSAESAVEYAIITDSICLTSEYPALAMRMELRAKVSVISLGHCLDQWKEGLTIQEMDYTEDLDQMGQNQYLVQFNESDFQHDDWNAFFPKLDKIVKIVDDIQRSGRKTVLHCQAGRNRSVIVALYVLMRQGKSFEESLEHLIKVRPILQPRIGSLWSLYRSRSEGGLVPLGETWREECRANTVFMNLLEKIVAVNPSYRGSIERVRNG